MSHSRKSAFTLIELLLVLALMGLLAGVTVTFSESLLNGVGDEPLSETLRRAVREARFQAASTGQNTYLRWDEDELRFIIKSEDGKELAHFQSDAAKREDSLTLEQCLPFEGIEVPDDEPDTAPIAQLAFAPDRSSTPFVAEIRYAGRTERIRYDAFSNLAMEVEP